MSTQKTLYCPSCRKYPDQIEEHYSGNLIEYREWDQNTYDIYDSNIDDLDLTVVCGTCGTELY